jgi:predicted PurR-regulated permease PerM
VARVLISFIVGVTTWLALLLLGVDSPAVWGVAAGVLNTIPYVGPTAIAVASWLAGLTQFGTLAMASAVSGATVVIAIIEGSLITPVMTGRATQMNSAAVFVGLSFWGWVWGIWGLLLAVPILTTVKAVCDHVDDWQPISELLGE